MNHHQILTTEHPNQLVTLQSPLFLERNITHGFTTRLGGASRGPYTSLNLAPLNKDEKTDGNMYVSENFRRLRNALGLQRRIRLQARQVHGCGVWTTDAQALRLRDSPQADAIVTNDPRGFAMIRTADCVPILVASDDGRVVAAIHAGWRGVVANIVGATLDAIRNSHSVKPNTLIAAVGPCIGVRKFEVGDEVVDEFEKVGLGECVMSGEHEAKARIDLRRAVCEQLMGAGIACERIGASEHCTFEDEDLFFSHRRDRGVTGRMAAVISPRDS